jgi:RNA polymerase sigma factor (sigma-70 family)
MSWSGKKLSQLSTHWSILRAAHQGSPEQQIDARRQLLSTYERAVRDYLRFRIHDSVDAEELFNEFTVRLFRGDLHATIPEKGRFRAYVKTVLHHLVIDYYRAKKRADRHMKLGHIFEPAVEADHPIPEDDRAFIAVWRNNLLKKAGMALQDLEAVGGPPLAEVFRLRVDHVDETDRQLAERLSTKLNRAVAPGTFRRWLHVARSRFADALVNAIAATLDPPTFDAIADELVELGLLESCRSALDRWHNRSMA